MAYPMTNFAGRLAALLPAAKITSVEALEFDGVVASWDWSTRVETIEATAETTVRSRARQLDIGGGFRAILVMVALDSSHVAGLRFYHRSALVGSAAQARRWTQPDLADVAARAREAEAEAYHRHLADLRAARDPDGVARRPAPGAKLARIEAMAEAVASTPSGAEARRIVDGLRAALAADPAHRLEGRFKKLKALARTEGLWNGEAQ